MASTYTNLLYHIVFSTKERRRFITPALRDDLYSYIGGIIRGEKGIQLEIGGMPDHLHLLVKLPPTLSISDALRLIKANPSKWVREQRDQSRAFGWQTGYGAFSVSESQMPAVRLYIQRQEQHHRTTTFQEELVALLEKNRIEFDRRYLWD